MKDVRLDKNYNIIIEKDLYQDDMIETAELIAKAKSEKKITEQTASLLLSLLLKREFSNEMKSIIPFSSEKQQEIHSLFVNLKTKQIKHA